MGKLLAPALEALAQLAHPRITVIRSGGLGDTILLLPALQWLRARLPGARVTLVGSTWAAALQPLVGWPLDVFPFDSPTLAPLFGEGPGPEAAAALPAAHAVILYTADAGSAFVRNVVQASAGPVVVWPVVPGAGRHAALHFLEALAGTAVALADLDPPALRVSFALQAGAARWIEAHLGSDLHPLAVHPGSGGRRKCWPPDRFAELVLRRGEPALLIEGPADAAVCRGVLEALPDGLPLAVARGLGVAELAAVLHRCVGYVGNDSGVSHLAAALGLPALAIFGPTDARIWAPLGARSAAIWAQGGAAWPALEDVLRAVPSPSPAPLPGGEGL
jgi:hypothetical protein